MPVTRSVSEGNYIIIVADCSGSDKDVGDVVTDLVIDIRESLGLGGEAAVLRYVSLSRLTRSTIDTGL